ncbi:uncharacterized protein LOC132787189 [Drosophila nasuta]|uniref:uncharacterized protein LOC132787189 n=1 Tax=Drosophila nasuta TaxID=42062 RepID=UPI00295E7D12|nr:uncharacterized protein LOC132787189 [Drosophila nasuta]XP_060650091.1 uncharacterized protein LOC132787189 [Drosophila nasuta]
MDLNRLINVVEQRPALWDENHPEHAKDEETRSRGRGNGCQRVAGTVIAVAAPKAIAEAANAEEAACSCQCAKNVDVGDADYNFVVSLVPMIKQMTALQNVSIRAKVSEVLLKTMQQPPMQLQQHPQAEQEQMALDRAEQGDSSSSCHTTNRHDRILVLYITVGQVLGLQTLRF